MDFRLTEEQALILRNMREFAERHVDPVAAEIDENSRHPAELFGKLGEGAGWGSLKNRSLNYDHDYAGRRSHTQSH
jgi:alkylation response protein AidB-like acyl-CoA dehydrogenase